MCVSICNSSGLFYKWQCYRLESCAYTYAECIPKFQSLFLGHQSTLVLHDVPECVCVEHFLSQDKGRSYRSCLFQLPTEAIKLLCRRNNVFDLARSEQQVQRISTPGQLTLKLWCAGQRGPGYALPEDTEKHHPKFTVVWQIILPESSKVQQEDHYPYM